jgi:HEAT repeat protein
MTRTPRQGRQRLLATVVALAGLGVLAVVGWKSWRIGLEHWYIAKLDSEDRETREHAADQLAAMASVRAVPYLVEVIASRTVLEGEIVIEEPRPDPFSEAIKAAGDGALPGLERKLRAENPLERMWAASLIGEIGPGAARAAGSLFPLLSDESPLVWSQAARSLGVIGSRSPAVRRSLEEALRSRANPPGLRDRCLEALQLAAQIPKDHFFFSLTEQERAFDGNVSAASARSVERLEAMENVSAVLAILADVIQEEDGAVRSAAGRAFLGLHRWPGQDKPPAGWKLQLDPQPVLVILAADREPVVRAEAVRFLARGWKLDEPVLALLVRALHDPEDDVRNVARLELKVMGPAALPAWIAALDVDHAAAWEAAADALAGMGAAARPAWPRLLERLGHAREDSVSILANALGEIGAASGIGVPELVSTLKSPGAAARRGAAEALRHYGAAGAAAGPALLEALDDADLSVRKAAALSLVSTRGVPLESLAEKVVPILSACLGDDDPFVWWRAGEALGALGPAAKAATPALSRVLKDRNGLVNPWALRALEAIGPEAEAAVPAVLSILAEDDVKSFADAFRALKAMGQVPDLTIPALRRLLAEAGPADADRLEKLRRAAGAAREGITNDSGDR